MEEQKHTPGPWKVTFNLAAMHAPYSMVVATFDCMGQHKHIICTDVTTPNAHLIAACPELLEACKYALNHKAVGEQTPAGDLLDKLEAAIAKAEGNGVCLTKKQE